MPDIINTILSRRSIRVFANNLVDHQTISLLLKAAMAAPSACNSQPWEFIVVNQPEVMIGNAAQRFDAEGNLTDATTADFIRQLLRNLVEWTQRIAQPQELERGR